MSKGVAQRKAAKAARRKKQLAERRSLAPTTVGSSLARRMLALANAPIRSCLVQEGLFERGNGMVMLVREADFDSSVLAAFLVDVYCLGVKDVVVHEGDDEEIDAMVAAMGDAAPFADAEPSYARKLLRDLVTWARSLGIDPAVEYAGADLLFGDASAESCDAVFTFGDDGKPLYIPGPSDTPAKIRRRLEQLSRRLGPDGFDFALSVDDEDFAEHGDAAYDPDYAPDPLEWLASDEEERLGWVEDYHRRAGIDLPNETVHAVLHVIVENQIAAAEPPSVSRTVERLEADGLDRHEAVHAIASVLSEQMNAIMRDDKKRGFSGDAYAAALKTLTAEGSRRMWESEEK